MSTLTKEQVTIERLLPDIRATHKEFLKSGQETVDLARQIGDMLWKLKECVKHGEWVKLVEDRCEFAIRTAQTYMKVSGGWNLLEKKEAAATTIDGCVKLIGQANPKKGGKTNAVRKAPKAASASLSKPKTDTPKPASEPEPEDDGPLNDEPIAELTFDERVKEANGKIESFCRQIVKSFEESCPKLLSIDHMGRFDSALAQVRAACSTLRTCKYHDEPCPKCKGEGCAKCEKESDFGAVTVLTYRQLAG